MAKAVGVGQSTVAYWVKTGAIPAKWHAVIAGAAMERGFILNAVDFVNSDERPMAPLTQMAELLEASALNDSPFLFYAGDDGTIKVQDEEVRILTLYDKRVTL